MSLMMPTTFSLMIATTMSHCPKQAGMKSTCSRVVVGGCFAMFVFGEQSNGCRGDAILGECGAVQQLHTLPSPPRCLTLLHGAQKREEQQKRKHAAQHNSECNEEYLLRRAQPLCNCGNTFIIHEFLHSFSYVVKFTSSTGWIN